MEGLHDAESVESQTEPPPAMRHPTSGIDVTLEGLQEAGFAFKHSLGISEQESFVCQRCQDRDDESRKECALCLGTGGRCGPLAKKGVSTHNRREYAVRQPRRVTTQCCEELLKKAKAEGSWVALQSMWVWRQKPEGGQWQWDIHPRYWKPQPKEKLGRGLLQSDDCQLLMQALQKINEVCAFLCP